MKVELLKGDNISSVNIVRQFTFNFYFHCCYRCCYMYLVDVNRDESPDFSFLHSHAIGP